jgi:hypothetical protein
MATAQSNPVVIAAHVRSCDPPQFIAEDLDELIEKVDTEVSLEQCDNCGNSLYVIRRDANFDKVIVIAFYVECVPDKDFWTDNGLEIPEGVGCGTRYRLAWKSESEVAF